MKHGAAVLVLLLGAVGALAEPPHIGYAFPAGGARGSRFELQIGGQYLEGATNVFVSGEGVNVHIERYATRIDRKQLGNLFNGLKNATDGLVDKEGVELERLQRRIEQIKRQLMALDLPEGVDPLNRKEVMRVLNTDSKEQFNPQIADRLRVRVSIDEKAPPGERELRVYTSQGLSNPVYFQVGMLEETLETEPNDDHMGAELQTVVLPTVVNGQIRPGDIDHFRFAANKGDSIVVDVGARRIIPYLADAVPGWFQAVVALYDEEGNEVAYQDDYKFNPDPVLFFDVPKQGTYTLSIRDAIYRGREDFIYRIAIGELPFITGIFPLGAQQGQDVEIALSGKNLPQTRVSGALPNNGYEVRHVSVKKDGYRSNQMPFAIGDLPECFEGEPNDTVAQAQPVDKPLVVNGRIQQTGDRDVFGFSGRKGEIVSIEVVARRLNSPLDSVIALTGPGIDPPVRNDDHVDKDKTHLYLGSGLVTHHADSYLFHELPETGTYFVEIADAQGKGGHEHAYRLRISNSKPDFKLRMEPSGLHIAPGGTAAFTVRALREDGFDGPIKLSASDLPKGFIMSEAVIPRGEETTRFTITAPLRIEEKTVSPGISGTANINGKLVTNPAVPVDDQMQAFLYRHLVPAQELVLAPVSERPPVAFEANLPKSGVIELPLGKEMRITFSGKALAGRTGCSLRLDHPPEGITMDKGWIGRKKNEDGKPKGGSGDAAGSILITAAEPLKVGDKLSLVVSAEVKRGKETTLYPAPAFPVKIVKASD